jgi:hypothetical protein
MGLVCRHDFDNIQCAASVERLRNTALRHIPANKIFILLQNVINVEYQFRRVYKTSINALFLSAIIAFSPVQFNKNRI